MFNFFDTIINFFDQIGTLIGNFLSGLVTSVTMIYQSLQIPVDLLFFLPSFLSSAVMMVAVVAVIKAIFGR